MKKESTGGVWQLAPSLVTLDKRFSCQELTWHAALYCSSRFYVDHGKILPMTTAKLNGTKVDQSWSVENQSDKEVFSRKVCLGNIPDNF